MKKIYRIILISIIFLTIYKGYIFAGFGNLITDNSEFNQKGLILAQTNQRFDKVLDKSIEPIKTNLDAAETSIGTEGAKNFVIKKMMNIIVPLIIVIGILIAMLGFYKVMFSDSETAVKEGFRYITYGVVGTLIIMSANYISTVLFDNIFGSGISSALSGIEIADKLYEQIFFPFIKLSIYIVLGGLFISLAFRVFTFITSLDDSAQKKSIGIILWDIVAMIIIIGSKGIIEAIYGKREEVININAQNLGEIGTGILDNKNVPILYKVINRVLGITTALILIIIIFQSLQILLKPDDPDKIKKMKKSLIYIFFGILIIGAGYVISNVLVVN